MAAYQKFTLFKDTDTNTKQLLSNYAYQKISLIPKPIYETIHFNCEAQFQLSNQALALNLIIDYFSGIKKLVKYSGAHCSYHIITHTGRAAWQERKEQTSLIDFWPLDRGMVISLL